jgi:hypothetical protein
MKIAWRYLTIVLVIIVPFIMFIVFTLLNSSEKNFRIKQNDVKNITLINNKSGTYKTITKEQDVNSICDLFNSTHMDIIKEWNGHFERDGGESYTFVFNLSTGLDIKFSYYDGSYLFNNGSAFHINSTKFETFWNLNYEEKKL